MYRHEIVFVCVCLLRSFFRSFFRFSAHVLCVFNDVCGFPNKAHTHVIISRAFVVWFNQSTKTIHRTFQKVQSHFIFLFGKIYRWIWTCVAFLFGSVFLSSLKMPLWYLEDWKNFYSCKFNCCQFATIKTWYRKLINSHNQFPNS